jgi:hypothetical protein
MASIDVKHAISAVDPFSSRVGSALSELSGLGAAKTTITLSTAPKSVSSSDSDDDSDDFGFAIYNLLPGVTGITGITGTVGPVQLFGFTGAVQNNCVMHLDLNPGPFGGSTIVVDRAGWYNVNYQYTLINDPSYLTDLFFYTGLLVNGVIDPRSRRYKHMNAAEDGFPGTADPTSVSPVYLPCGSRINMYFEAGGAMPITLKQNASAILVFQLIRSK